jgi:hypothetical protein
MRRLLPVALVFAAVAGLYAAQSPTITAREAKAHLGLYVTIEDTVIQVTRDVEAGFTYMNFGGASPDHIFRVVLPDALRARIDSAVLGAERVRVRGVPRLGPGDIPEIVCSVPEQLAVPGQIPLGVAALPTPPTQPPTTPCCRVCTTGKACGNTCIARKRTCRTPPGCACNGGAD